MRFSICLVALLCVHVYGAPSSDGQVDADTISLASGFDDAANIELPAGLDNEFDEDDDDEDPDFTNLDGDEETGAPVEPKPEPEVVVETDEPETDAPAVVKTRAPAPARRTRPPAPRPKPRVTPAPKKPGFFDRLLGRSPTATEAPKADGEKSKSWWQKLNPFGGKSDSDSEDKESWWKKLNPFRGKPTEAPEVYTPNPGKALY